MSLTLDDLSPKCTACGHCGKHPVKKRRVNGHLRLIYECGKHGIEVGESSVICDDATNFPENYAKRLAKPQIPLDQMLF